MIVSLVAVLLIGAIAWSGAVAGFQSLLGVALPLWPRLSSSAGSSGASPAGGRNRRALRHPHYGWSRAFLGLDQAEPPRHAHEQRRCRRPYDPRSAVVPFAVPQHLCGSQLRGAARHLFLLQMAAGSSAPDLPLLFPGHLHQALPASSSNPSRSASPGSNSSTASCRWACRACS